ncbi:MAG: amidohydrolase family protein [bacterium]
MTQELTAIDIHVHPADETHVKFLGRFYEHAQKYFRRKMEVVSLDETADYYRSLNMMAVLLALDCESNFGTPPVSNDHVAAAVRKHPDVFMGFGSVDPWKGKRALQEVDRIRDLGLIGMKFHASEQAFYANDQRFYPLWEKCAERGLPSLFHMGMCGIGAGAPGGLGLKLKYVRPIPYLDDMAADFPELTIIGAHPAWPWQDEMLAVAMHKANVYIDLSGWSPKYFPPSLVRYTNFALGDKVLFGSDYPVLTPERWMKDFQDAGFKKELHPKIFRENAKRLLKI